jgi:diguanylate cyclase (GGDEF)-like protein
LADKAGVQGLAWFRPRAESTARRVLFALTAVAAGVTAGSTLLFPTAATTRDVTFTVIACGLIVALAAAMLLLARCPLWIWASYPFAAISVITVLDLASADASLTGQIFFVFPVLYAAGQLHRYAAISVCVAAVVADTIVTVSLLPGPTALTDSAFLAAALATATTLLSLSGERNDRLIVELERTAAVDPLTGLVTRRVLDSAALTAMQANDLGTALLLIDLDRFKQVNDTHGHPAGDLVLQQLAGILTRVNRRTDIVSRLGGDEIAVLLTACPLDSALYRAEQILLEVRAHTFDVSEWTMAESGTSTQLSLSVSIGVAHLPMHAADLRELYAAADTSLYRAKTAGRDRIGALPGSGRQTLAL